MFKKSHITVRHTSLSSIVNVLDNQHYANTKINSQTLHSTKNAHKPWLIICSCINTNSVSTCHIPLGSSSGFRWTGPRHRYSSKLSSLADDLRQSPWDYPVSHPIFFVYFWTAPGIHYLHKIRPAQCLPLERGWVEDTPTGHYKYLAMLFGLTNAPAVLPALIKDICWTCSIHLPLSIWRTPPDRHSKGVPCYYLDGARKP